MTHEGYGSGGLQACHCCLGTALFLQQCKQAIMALETVNTTKARRLSRSVPERIHLQWPLCQVTFVSAWLMLPVLVLHVFHIANVHAKSESYFCTSAGRPSFSKHVGV